MMVALLRQVGIMTWVSVVLDVCKDVCKNILQLLCTVLKNTASTVVWPSSFAWVDASEGLLHLSGRQLKHVVAG